MPDDLGAHEFVPQAAVGCARCGVRPDHPIHEVGPKPMTVIADRSATIVDLQQQLAEAQGQAREYRAEVMRLEKLIEERDLDAMADAMFPDPPPAPCRHIVSLTIEVTEP